MLNEVGSRIDQIQQEQQDLASLTVQGSGDSLRIVKNKSIPQALERIAKQFKQNKEQITQLETLAVAKTAENQGLRAVIERLKKQNDSLEHQLKILLRRMGSLSKQVKNLETEVGKLETEVGEKEKEVGEKEREIEEKEALLTEQSSQLEKSEAERWAGYFVVGTRKELRERAILTSSGPLQALRRPRLAEHYGDVLDKFEKVDVRIFREIRLGKVKEIEILPARPASSYEVEKRDGQSYLLIKDTGEFWKTHRHVVVVRK